MRMFVLYVGYYGLAVLLGFLLRARFDAWMYGKPHMQRRLVVYSSDVVDAVQAGADAVPPPPLTVDTDAVSPMLEGTALSRFVRPTEADQRLAAAEQDEPEGAPAETDAGSSPVAPDPADAELSGTPPGRSQPYQPG